MDDYQQPRHTPAENPAQPPAAQPQAGTSPSWSEISGQSEDKRQGPSLAKRAIPVVFVIIILVAAGVLSAVYLHSKKDIIDGRIRNGADTSNISPAKAVSADTPLGQLAYGSGGEAGLAIKVGHIVLKPQTTGDAADAGMLYMEIDLSVTNNTQSSMIVPGTFYYQTAAGKLISTATSTGDKSTYANKNVQVVGKDSLEGLSLPAGQTDASHYLIFQVPSADISGKLIWFDGYYDTKSTKLAIFDLR